jgi:hypothetical protein
MVSLAWHIISGDGVPRGARNWWCLTSVLPAPLCRCCAESAALVQYCHLAGATGLATVSVWALSMLSFKHHFTTAYRTVRSSAASTPQSRCCRSDVVAADVLGRTLGGGLSQMHMDIQDVHDRHSTPIVRLQSRRSCLPLIGPLHPTNRQQQAWLSRSPTADAASVARSAHIAGPGEEM